ncbi:hypothetical protein Tco_0630643 [Tanacetum coccineum]
MSALKQGTSRATCLVTPMELLESVALCAAGNAFTAMLKRLVSLRIAIPLVTRSILEVVIPQYAVPKLITKSRNKIAQISEFIVDSCCFAYLTKVKNKEKEAEYRSCVWSTDRYEMNGGLFLHAV